MVEIETDNELAALPGVQRLGSTLVMWSVAENRPCPSGPPPCAPGCSMNPGRRALGGSPGRR
ncbi:hypothetical protein [Nonomuraea roseola]|uniref:Uncharacterized protein n=1 Tax=Nonomuraea roseola TaxID=46179 RepID=A0ABV5QBA4_9ACTN